MKKSITGLGSALITPFNEKGKVDIVALRNVVASQANFVDFFVVLGTTAETATLSENDKRKIMDYLPENAMCKPLVLGIGGNNTVAVAGEVASLSNQYKLSYSAILTVCPFYNRPSQEGLFRHFVEVASRSALPIILYNVPARTGVNLLPETVMRIYNEVPEQIYGIKEAGGNIAQLKQLISLANGKFKVFSGDDNLAYEAAKAGADGLISVASNAFPADFYKIVHLEQDAEQLMRRYSKMVSLLFKEGSPAGIKTLLTRQGLIKNYLRLPLVPNSPEVQNEIFGELDALNGQLSLF